MNYKIPLTEESQLESIVAGSFEKKAFIFKHSSRCGISSMVLKRFEKSMPSENIDFDYYLLDILKNRDISNLLANKFGVRHESPQLLVLKNGDLIAHDSHYAILEMKL